MVVSIFEHKHRNIAMNVVRNSRLVAADRYQLCKAGSELRDTQAVNPRIRKSNACVPELSLGWFSGTVRSKPQPNSFSRNDFGLPH